MAKFTRSGGEANALAVKLDKSSNKKIKFLFVVIMDGTIGIYHLIFQIKKI